MNTVCTGASASVATERKPFLESVHRRLDRPRAFRENEQVLARPQRVAPPADELACCGRWAGNRPAVVEKPMNGFLRMLLFIRHVTRGSRARKCVASIRLTWLGAKIVPRMARRVSISGKSIWWRPIRRVNRAHPPHAPVDRALRQHASAGRGRAPSAPPARNAPPPAAPAGRTPAKPRPCRQHETRLFAPRHAHRRLADSRRGPSGRARNARDRGIHGRRPGGGFRRTTAPRAAAVRPPRGGGCRPPARAGSSGYN